ncbi:malate dehydrogenase, NAD-dependent [Batrachochytrium salamandrivorans]|nr:malate dehydrogenase, NAD-dependent [Batrachochytrium salamandrivorans]
MSSPKVVVLGAAGGIGQPLSLLLKTNPLVGHLALYDVVNVPGVAADLSHINTQAKVTGHVKEDIASALAGADFVIIPAGVPRKPGMTRDDLFNTNAGIVANLAEECAKHCPNAAFLIISNPVNSTVPIFREVLRKHGKYNPKKLFGVTSLDVVRSNAFVGEELKTKVEVPVIGGHAGTTILPLLSAFKGLEDVPKLTKRIQFAGDEVVEAKNGAGSATLSMAYAGAHFLNRLLDANAGKSDVIECCFVESPLAIQHGCEFFASPVLLGRNGEVANIPALPALSEFEQQAFDGMIKDLKTQIEKGIKFVPQ